MRSMPSLTNQESQAEHAPAESACVGFRYFKGILEESFLAAPDVRSSFASYSQGGRRSEGNNAPVPPPPPPEPDSSDEARPAPGRCNACRCPVFEHIELTWKKEWGVFRYCNLTTPEVACVLTFI